MDPTVTAAIAVVAALIAVVAFVKASAAERRAAEAEARATEALERSGKAPAARKALPPEPEPAPDSAPRPEPEPEPEPEPAAADDEVDPAVVARAQEMFGEARAIAQQIGFDYLVKVGAQEGYRVSVEVDSDLDGQAIAYLEEHEDRILEVRRTGDKTRLVVQP